MVQGSCHTIYKIPAWKDPPGCPIVWLQKEPAERKGGKNPSTCKSEFLSLGYHSYASIISHNLFEIIT